MKGLQKLASRDDTHVLLQATNAPIQSTSADVLKAALIRLHDRLSQPPFCCRLLLTVSC
jgi:DNA polymerase I-like protein with 3'-5' exonuclease and polymerase domains